MRTGRPVRAAGVPPGRNGHLRWAAILSVAGVLGLIPAQAPAAAAGKSLITLRSGEVIEGTVAKKMGENYILHTGSGLRLVAVLAVEKIEDAPVPPPPDPRGGSTSPRSQGGARADAAGSPGSEEKPAPRPVVERVVDPRLEAARAGGGGALPVLEIALKGTVAGKPLNPSDAFTLSRLTYFFSEHSRPRFEVLSPGDATGKAAPRGGATGARPPEYRVELVGLAEEKVITFYNTEVLKTYKGQVSLRLIRLSDKKVVDGVDVVEDEGGDPSNAAELCRKAYNRAVESLLRELKNLPTFSGGTVSSPPGAPDGAKGSPAAEGETAAGSQK